MLRILFILVLLLMLSACGPPPKPRINHTDQLIAALIAQNDSQVNQLKSQARLSIRNQNIVNLYVLAIRNKPYQLMSHSQQLLQNYHHYNAAQQAIIKPLIKWAYAHPIYRQETAKQVRLLQRETLLVAPSEIDFVACEQAADGCATTLRQQVQHIVSPAEFTATLIDMAHHDPCINLSKENLAGEFGNQCLASRKGDLKVNLLSKPNYLFQQWAQALTAVNTKP